MVILFDYPWNGTKRECKFNKDKCIDLISGYASSGEDVEANAVNFANSNGIGVVSIDSSLQSFQLYESGIYIDKNCGTKNNYVVNIVGYGVGGDDLEADLKYWICRNCWGKSWGEEGYFRILRDANHCGIADYCIFPLKFKFF